MLNAAAGRAGAAGAAGAAPVFRRFALVISSNDGGRGRASLHFADSDARSIARVLESLGGVERQDLVEVKQASRERLRAAFAGLRTRMEPLAGTRTRTEVFVYYSGHSDEDGLLLGDERVPYRELRGWIEDAGADVRIAVLDSCASGALVRLKGGIHRPPFLSDLSAQTRGHAYLTASSADESAQESDRIGAAFFTHYFISGLRGAADTNRDRRVTLNEAYHFAYNETLRRTEGSMAGAQHPAYDIQLAGTGDLVITDLHTPRARLVMPEHMAGRIYVRDDAGRLVAELRKEPTYPVELGLEPGAYHVVLDRDGRAGEASVRLEEGGSVALAEEQFTALPPMFAAVRGGQNTAEGNPSAPAVGAAGNGGSAAEVTATAAPAAPTLVTVPFAVGIWPSLDARPGQRVHNRFVLGLLIGHSDELDGVQLSLVGSVTEARMRGAQISNAFNLARGDSEGLQLSAGVNISTGQFRGLQLAPVNVAMGDGVFRGAQLGVVNLSQGRLEGASVGVVNLAQSQRGASLGVVNLAGERTGHTIGVVNLQRKVEGFSLGVVNVADEVEGESLGVVTWAGNGIHQVDALASDVAPLGLGLKLGTRHLYTAYELGFAPGSDGPNDAVPTRGSRRYALGLGVGYRMLARETHFLDLALMGYGVHHAPFVGEGAAANTTLGSLRLTFGWRLLPHLALMAGPTFNIAVGWSGADLDLGPSWLESVKRSGSTTVRMYPGFVAGIEL